MVILNLFVPLVIYLLLGGSTNAWWDCAILCIDISLFLITACSGISGEEKTHLRQKLLSHLREENYQVNILILQIYTCLCWYVLVSRAKMFV